MCPRCCRAGIIRGCYFARLADPAVLTVFELAMRGGSSSSGERWSALAAAQEVWDVRHGVLAEMLK